MLELEVEPNTVTYSALVTACEKGGQWERAFEVVETMRAKGVKPNEYTFAALISACEKCGHVKGALRAYEMMREEGVKPDVVTFNALVSACEKSRRWEQAVVVVDEMRSLGLRPNLRTYNALISAFARGPRKDATHLSERALAVLEEMRAAEVEPDTITYSALIYAFDTARRADKAIELYAEMRSLGLAPDLICYNAVIRACVRSGAPSNVSRALKTYIEMTREGYFPDKYTYTALLSGCVSMNRLELGLKIYRSMLKRGVQPNNYIFTALLRLAARNRDRLRAEKLFREMAALGVEPDIRTYTALLAAQRPSTPGRAERNAVWARVTQLRQEMAHKHQPSLDLDMRVYGQLLSALERCSAWADAGELLREAREERSLEPSTAFRARVMRAHVRADNLTAALHLFYELASVAADDAEAGGGDGPAMMSVETTEMTWGQADETQGSWEAADEALEEPTPPEMVPALSELLQKLVRAELWADATAVSDRLLALGADGELLLPQQKEMLRAAARVAALAEPDMAVAAAPDDFELDDQGEEGADTEQDTQAKTETEPAPLPTTLHK
mmetsp:Transcript_6182/g.20777  ORF Transcript_6182/g.20777 Transcript_6182/m.20777 type:complete len:562 (+) Transcript_6182:785-2470(+)